jgi:hypothetical protein
MAEHLPGFVPRILRDEAVLWKGTLQPRPESPIYSVRIQHRRGLAPKVFVDAPKIVSAAPHRYRDRSLCLYWPEEWSWAPGRSLAATIVPWAALWLFHYEIWLALGEWLAPESPHGREKK